MHDLIIIGAGPAGITAVVYAARQQMNTLVITGDIGGQAAWSADIENYTGYQFISGPELVAKFEEHMRAYSVVLKENELVTSIKKTGETISVTSNKGSYEARTAIIASGKRSRELNVPGEREFKNKGLTYCATCDGPLFSGKEVAVIGGANSALDAALKLMHIAHHTYIVNMNPVLSGDEIMRRKIEENKNVTVLNESRVTSISGEKMLSAIEIETKGRRQTLAVSGVFVEIGLIPNSEFAEVVRKNTYGEIEVNSSNETSVPGIFAAGDVTDVPEKQIIIAAGEGSKAALTAFRYLSRRK